VHDPGWNTQNRQRDDPGSGTLVWWKHEILVPIGKVKFLKIVEVVKNNVLEHLSIISRSVFHISLSPLTHSKSLTDLISNGWSCTFLAQFPSTGALVAIQHDFFSSSHFRTCVSIWMNILSALPWKIVIKILYRLWKYNNLHIRTNAAQQSHMTCFSWKYNLLHQSWFIVLCSTSTILNFAKCLLNLFATMLPIFMSCNTHVTLLTNLGQFWTCHILSHSLALVPPRTHQPLKHCYHSFTLTPRFRNLVRTRTRVSPMLDLNITISSLVPVQFLFLFLFQFLSHVPT